MMSINWFIGGPLVYFALAFFIYKTAATFIKYSKLPRHLRWDLYPVPHQGPEGSKYQKVDFGKLKPHISLFHELKEMSQEMIFIKKIFINKPIVWAGSFPLHAGLYLGIIWALLLGAGAIAELAGASVSSVSSSVFLKSIYFSTIVVGAGVFIAGLFGSLFMLGLRLMNEDMRLMSNASNFINLFVMIFLYGTGLAAWIFADPAFSIMRTHAASLLIFSPANVTNPLIVLQLLALCVFLIYLPFSRMMHFVGKYFFYHNIMWDDEMMKPGSAMENDIVSYLHYKMTWSAPHIKQGGTWVDQVTDDKPKEGEKNEKEK
jgi:nitrate reductase gamma subunit